MFDFRGPVNQAHLPAGLGAFPQCGSVAEVERIARLQRLPRGVQMEHLVAMSPVRVIDFSRIVSTCVSASGSAVLVSSCFFLYGPLVLHHAA